MGWHKPIDQDLRGKERVKGVSGGEGRRGRGVKWDGICD